jgi:hypothetical protein
VEYLQGFRYGQERLDIDNQRAWTVTSFCLVPFMSLYVSPCFSSVLGFISSLPQLAWNKRLCCCCCCCCWISVLQQAAKPFFLLAGPNVIESEEHVLKMAKHIKGITTKWARSWDQSFFSNKQTGAKLNLPCCLSFSTTGLEFHLCSSRALIKQTVHRQNLSVVLVLKKA